MEFLEKNSKTNQNSTLSPPCYPHYVSSLTENQRIVRHFILSSPPGQVWSVMEDCELLLSNEEDEILPDLLQKILEEYNENNFAFFEVLPSKKKVLICPSGKVGFGKYYSPKTKELYTVDHALLCIIGDVRLAPANLIERNTSEFRDKLEEKIAVYIKSVYESLNEAYRILSTSTEYSVAWEVFDLLENKRVFSLDEETLNARKQEKSALKHSEEEEEINKDNNSYTTQNEKHSYEHKKSETFHNICLIISARNVNLKNFWAGSWISDWKISFKDCDNFAILYGVVKVRLHLFEDGNVQMNHKKNFEVQIKSLNNAESFAIEVSRFVQEKETEVHSAIDSLHSQFGEESLKSLRRCLPLTRQKFNWNPLMQEIKNEINKYSTPNFPK